MEVHLCSVKAKSQAGEMSVKYTMTTQNNQDWMKISKGS